MHPGHNPYGMYIEDIEEPIPICVNMSGFAGFLATKILGEVWEDDYTGYYYEEGDENFVEMFMMVEGPEFEEDYDIFIEDEDAE